MCQGRARLRIGSQRSRSHSHSCFVTQNHSHNSPLTFASALQINEIKAAINRATTIDEVNRLEKALKRQGARHSAREVVDGLRGERAIGVGNGESDRDGGGALPDDAGPSERLGERSLLGASLFGGGGGGAAGRSGGAAGSRTRTL